MRAMLFCNAHMMQGLFLRLFGMSEKIHGLYFSTFQVSDKQRLIKAFRKDVKIWESGGCEKSYSGA